MQIIRDIYFDVRLERLWDTVKIDLPPLRTALARMLEDLEREDAHG